VALLHSLRFVVRSRASLHLEILALRHQLAVVNRTRRPRLRLTATDRVLWAWLSRTWRDWQSALHMVQPDTVVAWHRRRVVRDVLHAFAHPSRAGEGLPGVAALQSPSAGRIVATPEVGGLHHRYDRTAA
jgi:hypothetical protein